MRYETRTVQIGEWLGNVPADWDYSAFFDKWIGQNRDSFDRSVALFREMDEALRAGKKVIATQSGNFSHEVYKCGLYDGWAFWVPRPCYSYKGPIPGEHLDEFYNLTSIRTSPQEAGSDS